MNKRPNITDKPSSRWSGWLLVLGAVAVLGLVGALLGTIGLLTWIVWSGDREWKATKANLQANGERVTLAEFIPPKIPVTENFFADSIWDEVFDKLSRDSEGQTSLMDRLNPPLTIEEVMRLKQKYPDESWIKPSNDQYQRHTVVLVGWKDRGQSVVQRRKTAEFVLEVLDPVRPWLVKLDELSTRPSARAPLDYDKDIDMPQPHLVPLLRAAQFLMTRGRAELALGQNKAALEDCLLMLRLSETIKNEPLAITYLVRLSMVEQALSVMADGFQQHSWDDEQLTKLGRKLAELSLISALPHTFRTERGGGNQTFGRQRATSKEGVLAKAMDRLFRSRDQAVYNRILQSWIDQVEVAQKIGFQNASKETADLPVWPFGLERLVYQNTQQSIEALEGVRQRALETQDRLGMARIACALERWRLTKDSLPPKLGDLVPEYLPDMPLDLINHQEFHYLPEPFGQYKLYSVAMNGQDDEAKTDANEDWVWGVPRAWVQASR